MGAGILGQFFHIDAEQMFVKWSEETAPISEPFSMHLVYEKVAWQPFIANNIPHTLLDQASRFEINFSPILLNVEQA